MLQENYEQKELNSVVPKVEPKEDTKEECEEEDPMKHLTPVQRIYASNRVNFYYFLNKLFDDHLVYFI